jgi:uncharacterized membrane protein YeiB
MRAGALTDLVAGALVMGYAVCGLFFLRFWRRTADRLFLVFAFAFWLLAIQYLALVLMEPAPEASTRLYLIRLVAFLLILLAIVDKNRSPGAS